MIQFKIRGQEVLLIQKDTTLDQSSKLFTVNTIAFSTYIVIMSLITDAFFDYLNVIVFVLLLMSLVPITLFLLSRRFYMKETEIIDINEKEINISGSWITNRSRNFDINDYSKVVVSEYIGMRLSPIWICRLYVKRKSIQIHSGYDRDIAVKIARTVSEHLHIPHHVKISNKNTKRRVYKIGGRLLMGSCIVLFYITTSFLFVSSTQIIYILMTLFMVTIVIMCVATLMTLVVSSK